MMNAKDPKQPAIARLIVHQTLRAAPTIAVTALAAVAREKRLTIVLPIVLPAVRSAPRQVLIVETAPAKVVKPQRAARPIALLFQRHKLLVVVMLRLKSSNVS